MRVRRTDFSEYQFRCSSLGKLMVGAKPNLTDRQKKRLSELSERKISGNITDKMLVELGSLIEKRDAKPVLSETTKKYLKQVHVEEMFGRRYEIKSKYLDKGIQVEEDSISLYSEYRGEPFFKNTERRKNEWFSGEPDNVDGKIRDIKSSWSFETFPLHETEIPTSDYVYQLMGYMDLWDLDEAELIYCLVDTPLLIIEDEKRRASWKLGYLELPEDLSEEIERNMVYDDIPGELRVKIFHVQKDENVLKLMRERVEMAREYLNELSINLVNLNLFK